MIVSRYYAGDLIEAEHHRLSVAMVANGAGYAHHSWQTIPYVCIAGLLIR